MSDHEDDTTRPDGPNAETPEQPETDPGTSAPDTTEVNSDGDDAAVAASTAATDDPPDDDGAAESDGNDGAASNDEPDELAGTADGGDSDDDNSTDAPPARQHRREVPAVLVRHRVPGQNAEYDAGKLKLCPRMQVVLDSDRGQTVGTVIRDPKFRRTDKPLRRVLRVITDEDERVIERNRVREREAYHFCVERIKARDLPMKLVSVDLAHSGTRAVFYFSSADRVDFRALVKDLARRFHTRIEMRQIGVRDASRHTGGVGICGRELCCATWLPGFKPISIRMAKDQNLALNHQKLSGLCGRLRCCLQYEQEIYQKQRKGLPKVGKRVITPEGEGRVKDVNVLRRRVRVQLAEGGYAQFDADEIQRPGDVQQQQQQQQKQPRPARPKRSPEPPRDAPPPRERTGETDAPSEVKAKPVDGPQPESRKTDGDKPGGDPTRPRRRRRRRGRRGRSRKGGGGGGGSGGGDGGGGGRSGGGGSKPTGG